MGIAAVITRIRLLERQGAITPDGDPAAVGAPAASSEQASVETSGGSVETRASPQTPDQPAHTASDDPGGDRVDSHAGPDAPAVRAPEAAGGYRRSREPAVYAYCLRVCSADRVPEAVEASLHAFDQSTDAEDGMAIADSDAALLRATRAEAAKRVDVQRGLVRRKTCAAMPVMLAAHDNGLITSRDMELIDRHLGRCSRCRAVRDALVLAEQAFAERLREAGVP